MDLVKVLPALLAKIFIGRALGAKNANASAVLPDFADIALDIEASNIFRQLNCGEEVGVWSVHRRTARVVLRATDAPDSLILLFLEVVAAVCHVKIVVFYVLLVTVVVLTASPPSAKKGIVEVLKRLRRQGSAGS